MSGETRDGKPEPPYWAVIFPNQRTGDDPEGYARTAARMVELARRQPGCLGFDSARDAHGFGITVSYWDSLEAIAAWRDHPEHAEAQARGRTTWYAEYDVLIARVDHAHGFKKPD